MCSKGVLKQPLNMERIRPLLFFGDPQDLQAMIGPLKNALSDQRLKAKALVEVGPTGFVPRKFGFR